MAQADKASPVSKCPSFIDISFCLSRGQLAHPTATAALLETVTVKTVNISSTHRALTVHCFVGDSGQSSISSSDFTVQSVDIAPLEPVTHATDDTRSRKREHQQSAVLFSVSLANCTRLFLFPRSGAAASGTDVVSAQTTDNYYCYCF